MMTVYKASFVAVVLCCACAIGCVKLPRHSARFRGEKVAAKSVVVSETALLNINTATVTELVQLPGIGEGFAARIVEHRARFGGFRRKEHLLTVRGMGERRYEAIESLIATR